MLSQVKFLIAGIKANAFLIIAIFFLAIWVSLSAFINTSQFGDNFEQFNWAHSLEWGYWKHPPLTTWLLFSFQSLLSFNYLNTYFLAFICLSVTLFFYNKIGIILIGQHLAKVATLLLSSSLMFTWRSQMFNHNTVLVMMITILYWYYFSNIYSKNSNELKIINWLLFGTIAALCILTKYQSIIFFASLGIASYLAPKNSNNKISILGLCLSILIAIIIICPHLFWIFKNKFMIVHYTADRFNINDYSFIDQFKNLISFLVQQFRFFILPILILSILSFDKKRKKFTKLFKFASISRSSWIWGLIFFPFFFLIFLNQFCGLKLANHWGMSVFLFIPIFTCFFCIPKKFKGNNFLLIYISLQILSLLIFIFYKNGTSLSQHRRNDEAYPSKIISNFVVASWKDRSNCKISFISGPAFESGIVSVYSGEYPQVLEDGDFKKSPWINKNDIERNGIVVISRSLDNFSKNIQIFSLPAEVTSKYPFLLDFYWTITPPLKEC